MKVALVGCGAWGKTLARVFHELGVLGMVCDTTVRPELGFGIHGPIEWVFDPQEVFDDIGVTAVAIATPADTHYGLAVQAMQAGKDVFVEKPMALSHDHARNLVCLAKSYDRILMVGHILEYHPAVVEMVRQVRAGELGDMQYVSARRLKLGPDRSEGVLWSLAPHDVSVMLRLLGMPENVCAVGGAYTAIIHMAFSGGVQGHVEVSNHHPYKDQSMVVMGSKKTVEFFGGGMLIYERDGDVEDPLIPAYGTAEPLRLECQAFVDACTTRVPPLADGESGARVCKVLEIAQKSLDLGVHVHG